MSAPSTRSRRPEHDSRTRRGCAAPDDASTHGPQLRIAVQTFQDLGAAPWAEQAATEFEATGETARRRHVGPIDTLTPQAVASVGATWGIAIASNAPATDPVR